MGIGQSWQPTPTIIHPGAAYAGYAWVLPSQSFHRPSEEGWEEGHSD